MSAPATDAVVAAVDLLTRSKADGVAATITELAAASPPSRTVVVVGEIKRGKSSLVNSLLGRPELARVDSEIATATQVRYTPPSADFPAGTARVILPGRGTLPVDDVLEWVTVDGAHVDTEVDGVLPAGAEVSVASMFLPRTTIVDTPGVNGLDLRHVAAATSASEGACAVVMVCDALAPISSAELAFLTDVAGTVSAVTIVVTKTDRAMADWKVIVEENQKIVASKAGHLADVSVIGVSNLFALKAMGQSDPQRAEKLWDASGVRSLAAVLLESVEDPARMVRRNTVHCATTALTSLRQRLVRRHKTITAAPQTRDRMEAEKSRLAELRATQKDWGVRLSQRIAAVTIENDTALRRRMDDLRHHWENHIDSVSTVELARRSPTLLGDIVVDIENLTLECAADLRREFASIAVDLLADAAVVDDELGATLGGLARVPLRQPREYRKWKGFFDPQIITMAMAGGSLGSVAGSLASASALGAAVPFILPVAIPAWAAFAMGFRAQRIGKQNLTKWLHETTRQAQEDVLVAIRTVNNNFATELRLTYARRLDAAIADAQKVIEECRAQAKADAEQRTKMLGAIAARVKEIDAVAVRLRADPSLVTEG